MNHTDAKFLSSAAKCLHGVIEDISLQTRLFDAKERYRKLSEEVRATPKGPMRSVANEKRCEALAIVIDLENQLREIQ